MDLSLLGTRQSLLSRAHLTLPPELQNHRATPSRTSQLRHLTDTSNTALPTLTSPLPHQLPLVLLLCPSVNVISKINISYTS